MAARPIGDRSQAVLWLMDSQILVDAAIKAIRARDIERGIQCMQMAQLYYRQAAGKVEGLGSPPSKVA